MSKVVVLPTLALTLIQPWATLVFEFGKDIENRRWPPRENELVPGDRFWIHAGRKIDEDVFRWALAEVPGFRERYPTLEHLDVGALLGHVEYGGFVEASSSPWFVGEGEGQLGWLLSDRAQLDRPLSIRGMQKLWRVPQGALDDLARAATFIYERDALLLEARPVSLADLVSEPVEPLAELPPSAPTTDALLCDARAALEAERAAHAATRRALEAAGGFEGPSLPPNDWRELLKLMEATGADEVAPRVVHRFLDATRTYVGGLS